MTTDADDKDEVIDLDDDGAAAKTGDEIPPDRGDEVVDLDDVPVPPVKPDVPEPETASPPATEPRIPKSRFDEVNERMKMAEARLAEIEAARHVKPPEPDKSVTLKAELAEKTKAYHQALIDGEFDDVDKLSAELDDVRERITEARAAEIASKEIAKIRMQDQQASYADRVEQHALKIAEDYPFLVDDEENNPGVFEPETFEMFTYIRNGALSKGKDNIEAMNKALDAVLKLRGEAPKPTPSQKPSGALARKIAMANRQPPRPIGVGNRAAGSTTPTKVSEMDEEEFAKIPAAEKRRLRGDIV